MTSVKVRIVDDRIKDHLPKYQTTGSAGIDLRACIAEPLTLQPGQTVLIPSGMHIFIDNPNLVGFVYARSGLGHKNGIILGNGTGVIDSDYQGQLMVSLWNRSDVPFTIQPLDRIAQYVVVPVVQVGFDFVDSFEATERGEGGFGHSGTK